MSERKDSSFRMIDVSEKSSTKRTAVAFGKITLAESTVALIRSGGMKKGDVLKLAEVAGIMAAKNTPLLLPLCHPLSLEAVYVTCEIISAESVLVRCEAITTGKTGVEMEALCGVNAALLCIYDLAKAQDPVIKISDIYLESKEGGKSGSWINPKYSEALKPNLATEPSFSGIRFAVVTASDRTSQGKSTDVSGPVLHSWLLAEGAEAIAPVKVLPDDKSAIRDHVEYIIKEFKPELIITTGGTGLGPRDVTPEAIALLNPKVISGVGELLRSSGSAFTKSAWLSRSSAYLIEKTIVITLPGSPKACEQAKSELLKLIHHAVGMVKGEGH